MIRVDISSSSLDEEEEDDDEEDREKTATRGSAWRWNDEETVSTSGR